MMDSSSMDCDVTFLVEGKQFSVHKSILVAQSPVFEAMFSHDMKEKFENQVCLSDVTVEVFELFLNYLNTGKVSNTTHLNIMQLYEIADKYMVLLLMQQCDDILCNHVISTVVIELLQFSERYSLGQLKQICLKFITERRYYIIGGINNDSWKVASKIGPTLLMEMFAGLALKYQHYEFPDFGLLNLPFDVQLEEATTHHAVFQHTSELTFSKKFDDFIHQWYNSHYICPGPALKFHVYWAFPRNFSSFLPRMKALESVDVQTLSISYQSIYGTPDIFVHYSVKCMTNCKVTGRRFCLLHKRLSNEFSYDDDSFGENRLKRIPIADHWKRQFLKNSGALDRFKDQDLDVSLKMTIYMALSRKSGFHELKSLSRSQLFLDLKSAFKCGKHCDVSLLVEGKQFRAPKSILAAQSPVFGAMFRHDSNVQKLQSQVSLSDVTADVFELFLNHLYSGKFPRQLTIKIAFELLHISERYSTVQLTQISIKFIVDHCLEVIHKDYLEIVAKSMPKLMMQIVEQLALKYQHNEFPDRVPLDSPTTHISLEETLTHNAKSSLSFETSISWPDRSSKKYLLCTDTIPALKFELKCYFTKWDSKMFISYLSTANIFAFFSVTCKNLNETKYFLIEHFRRKLQNSDSIWSGTFLKLTSREVVDISLKIAIYKTSNRKLGFPEMKSLSRQQLLMDLKSMLEDGKHCDVVLLVEGKQFSAHKTILVNRSNVFEAMFRYDMKEKIENRVEMNDVKIDVFEQFVLYMYTGKVDFSFLEKYSMDLFVLADMHYLSTLAQMCLRMFGQSLTSESVAEQFELADRVGLTEFKQVCTDYMNKTN